MLFLCKFTLFLKLSWSSQLIIEAVIKRLAATLFSSHTKASYFTEFARGLHEAQRSKAQLFWAFVAANAYKRATWATNNVTAAGNTHARARAHARTRCVSRMKPLLSHHKCPPQHAAAAEGAAEGAAGKPEGKTARKITRSRASKRGRKRRCLRHKTWRIVI